MSLYGEVQKEVIQATLADDYRIDVSFRETTPSVSSGLSAQASAVEALGKNGNPFLATVGLRVEPAARATGVVFVLAVEATAVPLYVYKTVDEFRKALEKTVRTTLDEGLFGWTVTDCIVTLTEVGYASPLTTAKDFRLLTPLVLMSAVERAGTEVCEPIHRFRLEAPSVAVGAVLGALARLQGVPREQTVRGDTCTIEGSIPAAVVHQLRRRLPALTHGEGIVECAFESYRPVRGRAPTRPRDGENALNRDEYLLRVARRIRERAV